MFNVIHLEPNQVPAALRRNYTGKSFKARVCESMTIPATAGLWEGGSRDVYSAAKLETGEMVRLPGQNSAPWDNSRRELTVQLEPGVVVVEHSIFCGKDMGYTFYVHPDNAAKLLPAPVEITENERLVLEATRSFKASYQGRDRYDMQRDNSRYSGGPFMSRAEWNATKDTLIARGFLNKAGAITVSGRNAAR